jgi:hypothetical protein
MKLLRGKAERLVPSASVYAVSLFIPMLDQFPLLRKVDPKNWDFFVTIAGVFVGVTHLHNLKEQTEVRQEDFMDILEIVSCGLDNWNPDSGFRGFADCKAMFELSVDALTNAQREPRFIASDAVGWWAVHNLLGRMPESQEERKLVRHLGAAIAHTFSSWWSE